ncbi:hypothetical protein OF83DRAFT_1107922 [Amylostereum chailletii]|nr:hypothetical protein OF83DRAFT_1107922 [Amylostereum chailletii]
MCLPSPSHDCEPEVGQNNQNSQKNGFQPHRCPMGHLSLELVCDRSTLLTVGVN